jgi:hypothetical protein
MPFHIANLFTVLSSPHPLFAQTTKRAGMVAFLDSRKAERATARGVRKEAMEAAAEEAGGTTHVARSTEEFWALFSAKAKGSCFVSCV